MLASLRPIDKTEMEEREASSATTEGAKAPDKLKQPSKPWHSYISEELPRSLMDSRDSAIRSARSLHQNSSTHINSLQVTLLFISVLDLM